MDFTRLLAVIASAFSDKGKLTSWKTQQWRSYEEATRISIAICSPLAAYRSFKKDLWSFCRVAQYLRLAEFETVKVSLKYSLRLKQNH